MLPTKQEILEKATELWRLDRVRNGVPTYNLTPEENELRESGFLYTAQCELMRNDSSYREYLLKELGENQKHQPQPLDFDLNEGLKSGVFIAGGKQCGKTNLAKTLAQKYLDSGCVVKVFDVSQQWLNSSLPYSIEVKYYLEVPLYESVVFDLSRLYSSEVKAFVAQVLNRDFSMQVSKPKSERKWIVYVFEECQMLLNSNALRRIESQEILRLMSSGANYHLAFLAITQRPALCDASVMELAYQKYFARCDGQNDLTKIRSYIGEYSEQLEGLEIGQFVYDKGDTTKKISTPLFETSENPKPIRTEYTHAPLITTVEQKEPNVILGFVLLLLTFLGILWIVQNILGA